MNRSYWPDAEATGQLLTELAEGLADQFDTSVLAGQPNANLETVDRSATKTTTRNGVLIRRVRHTTFNKRRTIGRVLNMLTFLLMAAPKALFGPRPDIVVVETDPPLLCLLGAFVSRLRGARLIMYLQDIYPDLAVVLKKLPDAWPVRLLRRLFFATYRRADGVVVLSDDMRSLLIEEGVDPARVHRIPNWVDTSQVRPRVQDNRLRAELGQGRFIVMYSGNLGLTQRLETVIDAADALRDDARYLFVLIGRGATRADLEADVRQRGLDNVRFLDYRPKAELADSLSAADLHLIPLDPRLVRLLMPSKLYGILASGSPACAITTSDCELAKILLEERVGYVCPAHDPAALVDVLRQAIDAPQELTEMGRRARRLAIDRFTREQAVERFASLLGGLVEPQPARSAAA